MRNSRAWLALICLALASPALAVVEPLARADQSAPLTDPRWLVPPPATDAVAPVDLDLATPAADAARRFTERHGGQWSFRADPRSGRLASVLGSGIPLRSGHRPRKHENLGTRKPSEDSLKLRDVEPLVWHFGLYLATVHSVTYAVIRYSVPAIVLFLILAAEPLARLAEKNLAARPQGNDNSA